MKMSQLGSQIKSTQGAITSQREQIRQMAQAYKELSAQVKQTKTDLSAAQAAQNASGRGLSSAQADAQRLAASYKSQQAALNALKASLSAAGFNTSNFAASESRLAADIDRVNAALRQQQALSSAQANSNAASQNLTMSGANFMGAISTAQQIAAPFQSAIDNAMTFEHSMSRVKALTQTGNIMAGNLSQVDAEMAKLEGQARHLGATTQFTMTQAADAMGYLGMAGWKTEQIYGTMPGMLNLAAGAGTDLARTADIVSDNMTAMGVPVEKAGHFMDVYAYALTNSNVNLESLGETMKYAAPVAAAFGATLEDTAAMTMMMGNAGIKGSMAGTALRMGLLRLSGPPKKASKALDEMGVSVSDATAMAMEAEAELARLGVQYDKNAAPMDKMQSIITQLSGKMANMTAEEKLASVSAIFGANAASGWINILEQGPEVFNEYLNALRNCDGYSEQFAKTMNDDTRGAMIALESAMDAVQNSIGSALLPAVRAAAEAFTPIASAIAIFIQEHPGVVQAAAAIAAALTTIVVGAAAVKLAFAGWTFITSTITLVQESLAALAGGQMMTGLIANVTRLRTALFGLGGAATLGGWSTMFAAISTKAASAATAIRGFFASLTLGSAASGIATTLSSIGTAIAGAARAAMSFAFSPVGVALMALGLAGMYVYQNWDRVAPVFSNIAGIITGALSPAITQIQAAFSALSSSGAFSSLTSAASQLASVVGGTLVQAFAVLATVVASALAVAIRAIADFVTFASEAFTGVLDVFGKLSEGDFSGAWEAWQSHGSKAIENIKNLGSHVFDGVEQGAKNVQQTLDALNAPKMPTQEVRARHAVQFDEGGVAHSAPEQPAQPPIDTSATQAALDQVGNSAQNAATNMDGVNQATQQISQAGTDVQQFGAGMQTASTGVQQFGTAAQTSTSAVQQDASAMRSHSSALAANGAALQGNIGALDAFGAAASGACGGVEALSSAASSAAGSLGGLGSAVQAACAALASAGASAAAAKNAKGGIYKKGAFLTTFAEESPEAAIPLDKSQRAIDLWTQAGQMLGQLPGNANSYDTAERDELGNLKGVDIPEYNRITEYDSTQFRRSKRIAQEKQLAAQQAAMRQAAKFAAENLQQATQAMTQATTQATTEAVTEAATSTNYADMVTDELGNIKGLDIPEYNRI
ncbi:MAG: phage tail tape measure protein, partial [Selenomonadaceae bacterium]|nr:phage tail tape measure protein [Selenomonadaceae bacterium]